MKRASHTGHTSHTSHTSHTGAKGGKGPSHRASSAPDLCLCRRAAESALRHKQASREALFRKRMIDDTQTEDARIGSADVAESHADPHDVTAALTAIYGIFSNDIHALRQSAAYFRLILSIERDAPIAQVISLGVVPRLIELTSSDDKKTQLDALAALTNMTMGDRETNGQLLSMGILTCYAAAIESQNPDLIHRAVYGIGNVALDSHQHRQLILNAGFLPRLVHLFHLVPGSNLISRIQWAITCLLLDADPHCLHHLQACWNAFQEGITSESVTISESFLSCASSIASMHTSLSLMFISSHTIQRCISILWNPNGTTRELHALNLLSLFVKADHSHLSVEVILQLIPRVSFVMNAHPPIFTSAAATFVGSLATTSKLWHSREVMHSLSTLMGELLAKVTSADADFMFCIATTVGAILSQSPPLQDFGEMHSASPSLMLMALASNHNARVVDALLKAIGIAYDLHKQTSSELGYGIFESNVAVVCNASWERLHHYSEEFPEAFSILQRLQTNHEVIGHQPYNALHAMGDAALFDDLSEKAPEGSYDSADTVPAMDE